MPLPQSRQGRKVYGEVMYRENMRMINKPSDGRMAPIKIADDLYFVGTYQASVHLIDTGDGLVLIDTGYENAFYLVIESIWEAGFDPRDVKYIINTHWHWDHTESSAMMAALSGAKNIISRADAPEVEKRGYFTPDILVEDGDKLTLGNKTFEFMLTPGHTKGTLSVFFDTMADGKAYRVGMFGGAGANSLVPSFDTYYDGCRDDYIASCDRLLCEEVDIFIGNHTWNNDTEKKGDILLKEGRNLFIDPHEWTKFLDHCKNRCLDLAPVE